MFLTILGLILKILGITLSIPTALKHFKTWKDRRCAELYEIQYFYVRTGRKLPLSKWKRRIYKLVRMPLPHLWMDDKRKK